jgi:hypothetical protein
MSLRLGVSFGPPRPNGSVELTEVDPDGPVGLAGGQAGDLLLTIDGLSAMAMRLAWHDGSRMRRVDAPMSWIVERSGRRMVIGPAWRAEDDGSASPQDARRRSVQWIVLSIGRRCCGGEAGCVDGACRRHGRLCGAAAVAAAAQGRRQGLARDRGGSRVPAGGAQRRLAGGTDLRLAAVQMDRLTAPEGLAGCRRSGATLPRS